VTEFTDYFAFVVDCAGSNTDAFITIIENPLFHWILHLYLQQKLCQDQK